jgi:hypothetical protein
MCLSPISIDHHAFQVKQNEAFAAGQGFGSGGRFGTGFGDGSGGAPYGQGGRFGAGGPFASGGPGHSVGPARSMAAPVVRPPVSAAMPITVKALCTTAVAAPGRTVCSPQRATSIA